VEQSVAARHVDTITILPQDISSDAAAECPLSYMRSDTVISDASKVVFVIYPVT